jgi:hypothetical protein
MTGDKEKQLFEANTGNIFVLNQNTTACQKKKLPMHICSLWIHHIVFHGYTLSKYSANGNIVSKHDNVSWRVRHVIFESSSGMWDVIHMNLETSWVPFDEGNFSLGFDPLYGFVNDSRFAVTSVVPQVYKKNLTIIIEKNEEKKYVTERWLCICLRQHRTRSIWPRNCSLVDNHQWLFGSYELRVHSLHLR